MYIDAENKRRDKNQQQQKRLQIQAAQHAPQSRQAQSSIRVLAADIAADIIGLLGAVMPAGLAHHPPHFFLVPSDSSSSSFAIRPRLDLANLGL